MLIPIADTAVNDYKCWGEFVYLVPIADRAFNNYTCFLIRLQFGVFMYPANPFSYKPISARTIEGK